LFSFFIESPLEESRTGGAKRPNRKRENLANTRFDERSPPINSLCQPILQTASFWARHARTEASMLRWSDKAGRIELPSSRVDLDAAGQLAARKRAHREPLLPAVE
jgi:hypothetical protein